MIRIEDWSGLGGSTQRLHHKHSVITRYIHSVATVTLKDELAVFMMGAKQDRQAEIDEWRIVG